ncbi:uncharacterized protein LOC120267261 [Dioscorea cayenensis subsp. rotundata]|uniref:Uncharacterized protein LOC120267261 n=1 Tax=Dioscorea cayennensis subsp. rotundata TaxID=55577 RepID=A0AB40BTV9_DIOCR|nr:uncharacterized protein LOC120267261 [Dioscorea cayenensis subsp. rotundata]
MRMKRMAYCALAIPQEIAADVYSSDRVVDAGTPSQEMPTCIKDRDDLLRWMCESFLGTYVQRNEEVEQDNSTTVPDEECSENQQARAEDAAREEVTPTQAGEASRGKSTDAPTSVEEEVATILTSNKKFKTVVERGLVVEIIIDEVAFEKYGLAELLKERYLYKSSTFAESYSLSLVQEFYSNLLPSDKGITRVYVRGKWISFTLVFLNKFLEFKSEVKGNYEEGIELNEDVLKDITGGRIESWGEETRLSASTLIAKYNVLFRLGIQNWLPIPHNFSIVKELALLLFAVGTGKKFNLGRQIFQNIVKETNYTSSSTSLGYPAPLSQYLLQHGVQLRKGEAVTVVKKLKIS